MKIKRSKHVHHDSGYTPVVNCKLTSRRLVCGSESDVQGVADALCEHFAIHDDINVREFAHISHYAVSTSYQKLADYVEHGEMEPVPRIKGCYRPTPGHFGREE